MRLHVALSLIALSGLLAGCASRPVPESVREGYASDGAVSAEIVEQPGSARYQPVPGSIYFSPLPTRENATPEYPAGLLAQQLPPITLVARIVVDATGVVERAEVVERSHDQLALEAAVLSAVRMWAFIPLKRIAGSKIEPLPFTQEYRFTFMQVNGRAVVETGEAR